MKHFFLLQWLASKLLLFVAAASLAVFSFFFVSSADAQTPFVVDVQVAANSDDAYHVPAGWPGYSDADTFLYAGNTGGKVIWGGWRFTNLAIPAGATITNAYVELTQQGWGYGMPTTLAFEDSQNPVPFSSSSSPYHRWSTKTNFQLNWTWPIKAPDAVIRTPSLTTGIQELVNKHGAVNAFVLLEDGTLASLGQYHTWYSYEGAPTKAAKLHIEYTTGEDTNPPSASITVNGGASVTSSTSVALTLSCTDFSGVRDVRYSNDGVFDTEPFEPFSVGKQLGLPFNDGAKTVWYQCRDNSVSQNTVVVSDTIILDTVSPTTSTVSIEGDSAVPYEDVIDNNITQVVIAGESAMSCRWYDTDSNYTDSAGTLCAASGTQATCTVSTTSNGQYTKFIACQDEAGNGQTSATNLNATWIVNITDITPPIRSNGQPTGILPAGTVQATLSLNTNENATCKYHPTSGIAYAAMANAFAITGGTSHSTTIGGLTDNTSYIFYARCQDILGNMNIDDYLVVFSIAAPGPTIINAQVLASSDDAYHVPAGWPGYSHTDGVIYAGAPGGSGLVTGGWRFTNLNIPANVTITNAYGEFNQSGWGNTVTTTLAFEKSASPAAFSSSSTPAQRWANRTSFGKVWTWPRQNPGNWIKSPDITMGMQELVSAYGGLNNIVLLEDGAGVAQTQYHGWLSYDGSPALAAKLHIEYTIGSQTSDTAPPVRSNGLPQGVLQSGTTSATLSLITNEAATCKYSTAAGVGYAVMPVTFSATGGTAHTVGVNNLSSGTSFNYYVKCADAAGNSNNDDYIITFNVAAIETLPLLGNWDGSTARYSNVWAEGNFAYIGHQYESNGLDIIDISNPAVPTLAANWNWSPGITVWSIRVRNGIAYISDYANGNGLFILNVSDPRNPQLLSRITSANGGHDNPYGADIEGNFLFIPNNTNLDVHVFDVTSPSNPVKVRTIVSPGLKVHDVTVKNGRLYTSAWTQTGIFDVSNLQIDAPFLGSIPGGSHSSSVSDNGRYIAVTHEALNCLGGERGTITIWDVLNPANPVQMSVLDPVALGFGANSAHYPFFSGNKLYVSWLGAGVKVFDVTNIASPVHIASFDTTVGYDAGCVDDGNWGVYPLLGPNKILVSDWQNGLFILDASSIAAP